MRRRSIRTLGTALLCAVLVACGGNGSGGDDEPHDDPTSDPKPSAAESFADYVADLDEVAFDDVAQPDPLDRFSADEIAALAAIAQSLVLRSLDPDIAEMEPIEAVDHVVAEQLPESRDSLLSYMNTQSAGLAWQWNAASLLEDQDGEPRIVKIAWDAEVLDGTLANGDPLNFLSVTLQILAVHEIEDADHPVVVERTVVVDSHYPLDLPNGWWPGITILTYPYGNDGCELFDSQRLVPADSDRVLRTDLADLKDSYRDRGVHTFAWPEPDFYEEAVAACEDA